MSRIVLGVTGSVASVRVPLLFDALRSGGERVRVVATDASTYFFDPALLDDADLDPTWPAELPNRAVLRDSDEWPAPGYRRGDMVLHIALRDWADVLVVAPIDAHTLGKFALGLSDNALSCLFRA